MIENLFVLCVLGFSGNYVIQRLRRMGQKSRKGESGCDSCASASCAPVPKGEKELPLR